MTVDEIKASDKVFLLPSDISEILGCHTQYIRQMAHERPELLGFPVCVIGTRTRIPRKPFLDFIGEGGAGEDADSTV